MSDSGDRDELKARVMAWHRAVLTWTWGSDDDLPEWAAGIKGRDATPEDCARLKREADHRLMFGTAPLDAKPRGLIDFVRDRGLVQSTLTADSFDAFMRSRSSRAGY